MKEYRRVEVAQADEDAYLDEKERLGRAGEVYQTNKLKNAVAVVKAGEVYAESGAVSEQANHAHMGVLAANTLSFGLDGDPEATKMDVALRFYFLGMQAVRAMAGKYGGDPTGLCVSAMEAGMGAGLIEIDRLEQEDIADLLDRLRKEIIGGRK